VSASASTFGIHVSFDQDTSTLPAGFVNDVNAVVAYFQGIFGDTVNVNLHVGFGEHDGIAVDDDDVAETTSFFDTYTYAQIRTALANDAKDSLDSSSVQPAGYRSDRRQP
jgi:hypothetical protein